MDIKYLLNKLAEKQDLTTEEAQEFIDMCASGSLAPSQVAAVLMGLRMKGETPDEIVGLIEGMRKHMIAVQSPENALDTCGTGGDGSNTFNISTTVALVVAATGVSVAKHGNRAASSKCGSADVLEALGVDIMLKPNQASAVLKKVGFVFLFAPLYHPAMKYIAPVRKEIGIRTVFNFLGPLLNPAGVKRQIIGVPNTEIAKKLTGVLKKLAYDHVLLMTSQDGLDEISTVASTSIIEIQKNKVKTYDISPSDFGIGKTSQAELLGGDAVTNAKILINVLSGEQGPRRDIVSLNAGAALYVAGKTKSIADGKALAEKILTDGSAKLLLEKLIDETQRYA